MPALEVFYSYSHKDEPLRQELATHLDPLRRDGLIKPWHDLCIGPGGEWSHQIADHLRTANIILLLISPDFLASDYCVDTEMNIALDRHSKGEAVVIPLILRPSDWQNSRFKHLQCLPRDGKPVTKFSNRDEAFAAIAKELRTLVTQRTSAEPSRPASTSAASPDDIASLLEAMGLRILDRQPTGDGHHILGEYKAGPQIRRSLTCFLNRPARSIDLERLRQTTRAAERPTDGILLTAPPMPAELAKEAQELGIQAYGREEFINNLADFQPYMAKLQADYAATDIERLFVPLKTREEIGGVPQGGPVSLDALIDTWLDAPERNHLSLLGDFGTGKTGFTRRLAARLATRPNARIPILIPLRDYSRAYNIEQVLTDAFSNRFQINLGAGFKTISRLNQEGRLLLIFDGFDEMERRASDYRTALDNFWEIAKLITPRSKILLTCRTAFFRHRTDEDEVLKSERGDVKVLKGEEVINLSDRRKFEVLHLSEFDAEQIQEALRRLAPGNWEALIEKIHSLPNMQDLAHRPVLLGMIAQTLPAISKDEDFNLATLYQRYTDDLLRDRADSISPAERQYFVQELAWEMQTNQRLSVRWSEFPERVVAHFGLKDDAKKAAFFEQDIRTQSYLIRDDEGNYRFAHKSMQEYFRCAQDR